MITRGTTAALAVFPSFPRPELHSEPTFEEAKARLRSGIDRRRPTDAVRLRQNRIAAAQRGGSASVGHSVTASEVSLALQERVQEDHAAAVKRLTANMGGPPRLLPNARPLDSRARLGPSDTLGLAVSWERHALKFYAQRTKAQRDKDVRQVVQAAHRKAELASVQVGESALEASMRMRDALSDATPDALLHLAESTRSDLLQPSSLPDPEDPHFDKWMLARFGTTGH